MNSLKDACMQPKSNPFEPTFVKAAEPDQSKPYKAREAPNSPILVVCKQALSENFS